MLLTGTFERALDDKSRVAIPKRIRDAIGKNPILYLTRGTDGSLALYPEESFLQLSNQIANRSPTGPHVRVFNRVFFAQAERLEIDKQGRIRIPTDLTKKTSISREIVLLGVRDHIEIWDKELWEDYLQETDPDFDSIADMAFQTQQKPINRETSENASDQRPEPTIFKPK